MKTIEDYKIGQRVKMFDPYDKCNVYGHVVEVKNSNVKKLQSIVVKWNDMAENCEHYYEEFDNIKDGIPD